MFISWWISPLELEAIRNRYRILVAKLLFEHFPCFAMFKPYMSEALFAVMLKKWQESQKSSPCLSS